VNMKKEAARRFGEYVRRLREEKGFSMRGLASEADIDSGALTRLEHGRVHSPQPDTLKALAAALEVPLADMFAMAGYTVPSELPSISPYLRARYGQLPEEAIVEASDYVERLIEKHGLDPGEPGDLREEETNRRATKSKEV
jgi:transcriptional regulator with XRE-family HTH domain